jgi:Surface adhesin CshA repetitive domain
MKTNIFLLVAVVFFSAISVLADYSQDFESGTTGTANCAITSDFAVGTSTTGRTQASPVIAGTTHAVSGQLTTSNKFWETPWLSLSSGATLTFKHKRNNTTTTDAFIEITITDVATNTSTVIANTPYTGAGNTVFTPILPLGVIGVYKVRIRAGGTNGNTRVAIDDINITNAVQSTVGAGTAGSSACNQVIPGVTPPIANNNSATTRLNASIIFNIANDDTPQTNPLDKSKIDLNPDTSAIENSFTITGKGTFTIASNGDITFMPFTGFIGVVSITYTIRDTAGAISNVATVTVTVLGTTAANINIEGRATANGRILRGQTMVTLTSLDNGMVVNVITNPFGYFRFNDVPIGNYVVEAHARKYASQPQFLSLSDSVNGILLQLE